MTRASVCQFYGAATKRPAAPRQPAPPPPSPPSPPPPRRRAPPRTLRLPKRWAAVARRVSCGRLLLLPVLLLLLADVPQRLLRGGPAARAGAAVPFTARGAERPGVSIVAVCMNRHATLRRALRSWRAVRGVDEIVVVDWGSAPPLRPIVAAAHDPRVRLLRVDDERDWVLSRAYNLAMRAASRAVVVRTDCDYELRPGFAAAHALPAAGVGGGGGAGGAANNGSAFFAGNYRLARDANEVHLNGAVVIRRADFFAVGGYDERIQTYGWDDEDLYHRLASAGVRKRNVSYALIAHVPHSDGARAQHDVGFVQVEIDLNRLLLVALNDSWSPAHLAASTWAVTAADSEQTTLVAAATPRSLKQLAAPESVEKAWALALEQRLAADYAVPWDILTTIPVPAKRTLLARLNARAAQAPRGAPPPRILFAHVMHGLGNRLRALGSAMSFANATGRELVVVWETDRHIAAEFGDLFAPDLVVMPRMKLRWPFAGAHKWDKSWLQLFAVNYMEMDGAGAIKDKFVADQPGKHMYFKSAYVLNADPKLTNWELDNANLRALRPVPYVTARVAALETQGLGAMVGVHIRDRTLGRDIKHVDFTAEYGGAASRTMEYWRRKSSHRTFLAEMRRLLAADPATRFYVATDTVEVLARLRAQFPHRILSTPRDCDGRDGQCVRYALIDVLALARTRRLLGSNWSSFTEAAERLGGKKALLAGKDFAVDPGAPKR